MDKPAPTAPGAGTHKKTRRGKRAGKQHKKGSAGSEQQQQQQKQQLQQEEKGESMASEATINEAPTPVGEEASEASEATIAKAPMAQSSIPSPTSAMLSQIGTPATAAPSAPAPTPSAPSGIAQGGSAFTFGSAVEAPEFKMSSEIPSLQTHLSDLPPTFAPQQQQSDEYDSWTPARLREKVRALEAEAKIRLQAQRQEKAEAEKAKATVKVQQDEILALEGRIEYLADRAQRQVEESERMAAHHASQVESSRAYQDRLRKAHRSEVDDLKATVEAKERYAKSVELQMTLERAEAEERAEDALEKATRELERSQGSLSGEVEERGRRIEEAETRISDQGRELDSLRRELRELQKVREKVEASLERAEDGASEANKARDEAKESLERERARFRALEADRNRDETSLSHHKLMAEGLQDDNDRLLAENRSFATERDEAQHQLAAVRSHLSDLKLGIAGALDEAGPLMQHAQEAEGGDGGDDNDNDNDNGVLEEKVEELRALMRKSRELASENEALALQVRQLEGAEEQARKAEEVRRSRRGDAHTQTADLVPDAAAAAAVVAVTSVGVETDPVVGVEAATNTTGEAFEVIETGGLNSSSSSSIDNISSSPSSLSTFRFLLAIVWRDLPVMLTLAMLVLNIAVFQMQWQDMAMWHSANAETVQLFWSTGGGQQVGWLGELWSLFGGLEEAYPLC